MRRIWFDVVKQQAGKHKALYNSYVMLNQRQTRSADVV